MDYSSRVAFSRIRKYTTEVAVLTQHFNALYGLFTLTHEGTLILVIVVNNVLCASRVSNITDLPRPHFLAPHLRVTRLMEMCIRNQGRRGKAGRLQVEAPHGSVAIAERTDRRVWSCALSFMLTDP